ncbi:glycosyltransferase [Deinococcus pimensis]|uniref:glycosyltransferase n=1 Tax=Deinococcus pimensis TaxID=309888 RepID=UPI0004855483|nr:glycosyltransferase [Deinococcus pimensis]
MASIAIIAPSWRFNQTRFDHARITRLAELLSQLHFVTLYTLRVSREGEQGRDEEGQIGQLRIVTVPVTDTEAEETERFATVVAGRAGEASTDVVLSYETSNVPLGSRVAGLLGHPRRWVFVHTPTLRLDDEALAYVAEFAFNVVHSDHVAARLRARHRKARIDVLPQPIERTTLFGREEARKRLGLSADQFVLVNGSPRDAREPYGTILNALLEAQPSGALLLYDEGWEASPSGSEEGGRRQGRLNVPGELTAAMEAADAYVSLLQGDEANMRMIEAMARGLPVIALQTKIRSNVVLPFNTGFTVGRRGLSNALKFISQCRDLLPGMGVAAKEHVGWDSYLERVDGVIQRVRQAS